MSERAPFDLIGGGMAHQSDVTVDVDGRYITVMMRGSSFRASFFNCLDSHGLVRSDYVVDSTAIPCYEFLALAWKAASDKARELGWIL
jgi:hypothetical protein